MLSRKAQRQSKRNRRSRRSERFRILRMMREVEGGGVRERVEGGEGGIQVGGEEPVE